MVLALTGGCSIRGFAVDTIGDMLASDKSVFTEDDDIELIGGALPFSLKLTESLLAESPKNRNLLLTAARGYVLYAYAYVHFPAEQAADDDLARAKVLRARAGRLYLRALGFALRGLETGTPGFGEALERQPGAAAAQTRANSCSAPSSKSSSRASARRSNASTSGRRASMAVSFLETEMARPNALADQ